MMALDEYIQGLPEKARKRKFILECQRSDKGVITAGDIHQSIKRMEESKSLRSSKSVFRNVLSVVVRVMKDYEGVIQSLGMSLAVESGSKCITRSPKSICRSNANCSYMGCIESSHRCKHCIVTKNSGN